MATDTPTELRQVAPYPQILADLVDQLKYRQGWHFYLEDTDRGQGSKGLTLVITTLGYNTYHVEEGENYQVNHYMPVPPASYNLVSWQYWLFEQCLLVEKHEAMEFFRVGGDRPYAPNHGFGWSPYLVTEVATETDRRTNFRNEVVPE
jgi:hypothetical protein